MVVHKVTALRMHMCGFKYMPSLQGVKHLPQWWSHYKNIHRAPHLTMICESSCETGERCLMLRSQWLQHPGLILTHATPPPIAGPWGPLLGRVLLILGPRLPEQLPSGPSTCHSMALKLLPGSDMPHWPEQVTWPGLTTRWREASPIHRKGQILTVTQPMTGIPFHFSF